MPRLFRLSEESRLRLLEQLLDRLGFARGRLAGGAGANIDYWSVFFGQRLRKRLARVANVLPQPGAPSQKKTKQRR